MKTFIQWFFAFIMLCTLGMALAVKFGPATDYTKDQPEPILQVMCLAAEEAVSAHLKAPASAKFSECVDNHIVRDRKTGAFIMNGWVESQNGFGSMLRRPWGVVIKLSGNPWSALSYQVSNVTL